MYSDENVKKFLSGTYILGISNKFNGYERILNLDTSWLHKRDNYVNFSNGTGKAVIFEHDNIFFEIICIPLAPNQPRKLQLSEITGMIAYFDLLDSLNSVPGEKYALFILRLN